MLKMPVGRDATKPNGMGTGLSICRSIPEDHSGRLWATRLQPHGALFQFTTPLADGMRRRLDSNFCAQLQDYSLTASLNPHGEEARMRHLRTMRSLSSGARSRDPLASSGEPRGLDADFSASSFETLAEFIIGPRLARTRWQAPEDEGKRDL